MWFHFDSEKFAIADLKEHNFKLLKNGFWIGASGLVKASIHPIPGSEKVVVAYQPVL